MLLLGYIKYMAGTWQHICTFAVVVVQQSRKKGQRVVYNNIINKLYIFAHNNIIIAVVKVLCQSNVAYTCKK